MLDARVKEIFRFLEARGSYPILYRRLKSLVHDPETGETKTFHEIVATKALVYSIRALALSLPGGSLPAAECVIVIPRSAFTPQPGEPPYITPKLGDEVVLHDITWDIAETARAPFYWTDPTRTLYFVGLRRRA